MAAIVNREMPLGSLLATEGIKAIDAGQLLETGLELMLNKNRTELAVMNKESGAVEGVVTSGIF